MWEQVGVPDNLTVQDTEESGVKVALIWTSSKGTGLQKDLIKRQFYAASNHVQEPGNASWASLLLAIDSTRRGPMGKVPLGLKTKCSLVSARKSSVDNKEFWGRGRIP